MKPAGTSSAPLWLWGAIFAVVTGIVLTLALTPPPPRLLALDRIDRADPATRRIAVLGTSRTYCGLWFDQDMEEHLRGLGVAASFVRISSGGAEFEDLAPAIDRLAAARFDLVLIEADMLVYTWERYPDWRKRFGVVGLAAEKVRDSLDEWRRRISGNNHNAPPFATLPCDDMAGTFDWRQYGRTVARRRVGTADEHRSHIARIAQLQAGGTLVGLIDLGRSPRAQTFYPAEMVESAERTLAELLAGSPGLFYWTPSDPLPQEVFADAAHLNALGKDRFSRWFAGRIASLVVAADG